MDKTFLSYRVTSPAVKMPGCQLGLNEIGWLPGSCTAFPQAFTVNPLQWPIRHEPRDPKRFDRNEDKEA